MGLDTGISNSYHSHLNFQDIVEKIGSESTLDRV